MKQNLRWMIRRLRRGKPVLTANEFDDDNGYWDTYNGDCVHLISDEDRHHLLLSAFTPFMIHQLKNQIVLDLGCGVGRLNLLYDIKEYHGLDTSKRMLDLAQELNQEKTNAIWHFGDGKTLKRFSDECFDLVIANTVFLHLRVRTVKSYIKEIWRVLKPNRSFLVNIPTRSNLDIKKIFSPFLVLELEEGFKNDHLFILRKVMLNDDSCKSR